MRALKAGEVPTRGNPNNPDEQDEFVKQAEDNAAKNETNEEEKGGYPSLGPPPEMGLPKGDSESSSSQNDDSSEEDDEESDEPPPKKKETYKPPPPKTVPKGKKKAKGREFYKAIEQAKKHAKNCISNLGYNKVQSSIDEIEKALEILRELED